MKKELFPFIQEGKIGQLTIHAKHSKNGKIVNETETKSTFQIVKVTSKEFVALWNKEKKVWATIPTNSKNTEYAQDKVNTHIQVSDYQYYTMLEKGFVRTYICKQKYNNNEYISETTTTYIFE